MPTLEQPVARAGRPASDSEQPRRRRQLPRPNAYLIAAAGSILLAAASLAFPSSPSYDPWAWLIWGRQVLHLDLQTFGGPTWKPLPVLFTTVFAPFGGAAPKLWLLIARAGGLMGIAMAATLAYRLLSPSAADAPHLRRTIRYAPAQVLAAVLAASGLCLLYQYLASTAGGESEGLLVAIVLLAVLRHLDGAPRQALVLGFVAALIRPETWPFVGLYACWLWVRMPSASRQIAVLLALVPVLWFLPELWGSGSLFRGVEWAQYPRAGSAAFARCPFCTELTAHGWPLLLTSFKVGVGLALGGLALVALGRGPRTGLPRARLSAVQLTVLALAVLGIGWIVEEALLTQIGFTGSDRYLIAPEALLVVAGAVGWGVALRLLASRLRTAAAPTLAVIGCFVLLTVLAPEPGPHLGELVSGVRFDSRQEREMRTAVMEAGGSRRLIACGPVETNSSESPLAAWILGVPLRFTESTRGAVVIQSGNAQDPAMAPARPPGYRLLATVPTVRIYARCAPGP